MTRKDLANTSEIYCTNLDKSLANILQVNYKMESNEITAVVIERYGENYVTRLKIT